ncbi:hypothetical protein G7Y89_g5829 [Cudoniella acicularis]|uniref:Uncharacterized protein n=1 Tax=Cudoniella acicularis TaxID=354080 RepID=A0A8H4RND9_9HELO|nr:hypothetical protein G7Y89_g5829 [Cudoniella acicularis]
MERSQRRNSSQILNQNRPNRRSTGSNRGRARAERRRPRSHSRDPSRLNKKNEEVERLEPRPFEHLRGLPWSNIEPLGEPKYGLALEDYPQLDEELERKIQLIRPTDREIRHQNKGRARLDAYNLTFSLSGPGKPPHRSVSPPSSVERNVRRATNNSLAAVGYFTPPAPSDLVDSRPQINLLNQGFTKLPRANPNAALIALEFAQDSQDSQQPKQNVQISEGLRKVICECNTDEIEFGGRIFSGNINEYGQLSIRSELVKERAARDFRYVGKAAGAVSHPAGSKLPPTTQSIVM